MSKQQSNILFEDNLLIESIDKDGKKFEKVSRIEATAEDSKCSINMDINVDIYPISKDSLYSILLVKVLDEKLSDNHFNLELYTKSTNTSLINKYEYIMYGKIFKFTEEPNDHITIFASFGGLLFSISGETKHLAGLEMDSRIYLLLKKMSK